MILWLSDTLLAVSALLLLVLLIRAPVARYFGAGAAYLLWVLPAARLLMPSLTREVAAPVFKAGDPALTVFADSGTAIATAPAGIDWTLIALSLWLGGAALLFIVQMFRYAAMREELLSDATQIDRIGTVSIIQTDRVGGPLAFGLISRYVAVPRDFTRTFSPRERELALAHELAHHRGGDLFANMAGFIVLCVLWFNPLAWIAWNAFRFDQEAACDARVIAGADALTRQTYGRALARTATTGLPALAMALNSPATIIQRLRRLMMNETSTRRRMTGKLAILAAAVIALPLTATIVPVYAEAEPAPASAAPKPDVPTKKIIVIRTKDGKGTTVNVSGDEGTPFTKTIKRDGKTITIRSSRDIPDAELDKLVAEAEAEAEKAAGEAEAAAGEAEAAKGEAEAARGEAEAARGEAEAARADALAMVGDMDFAAMVPDIRITQARGRCNAGEPVTSDVTGFDGKNRGRIRIVMCGKAQAGIARAEALTGLREARAEIADNDDMPKSIRKSVLNSLQVQIDRIERQLSEVDRSDT